MSWYSMALEQWLADNGEDPESVEIVTVPPPNLIDALLNKQVDAISAGDFVYSALEKQHSSEVTELFSDTDAFPEAEDFVSSFVFTDEYAKANPEIVRAFIAGLQDAADIMRDDPEQAKQYIADLTKANAADLPMPGTALDLCIDLDSAQSIAEKIMDLGVAPEGTFKSADDWATNEYNPKCG